ncbi:thioredoxin family protein [Flavobacterium qiangtangense]|uniref:Thioredoxin family protein n=1 Tax=Flavobacterium qiangtangense TaxID=1442595 RepID=A0ABW1PI31_9FLAO
MQLIKTYFFLFTCIFILQNTSAQNSISFDESSFDKIILKAKKEKKPIFYMAYATWCPHCNKMKKEVLSDKNVIAFFNANFVNAQQDVDEADGKMVKEKLGVKSLPTFAFLDENGTVLYRLSGEYSAEQFLFEAKNALNPKLQLPYLEKQFNEDISNADKCLAYISTLRKGTDRKTLSVPAHKYLATQTEKQLASEKNWMIISNGVTDIQSKEFQYVLNHKKDFEAIVGEKRVTRKLANIVTESLKPLMESLDTTNYYKQRGISKTVGIRVTDSLIFNYDLTLTEASENWKNYSEFAGESVTKFAWENPSLLKEIAMNYEKNIADKSKLKEAITWMSRSLELNESYDGFILMSKLYGKTSDKNQAISYAKKARKLGDELGVNPEETNALYKQLGIK